MAPFESMLLQFARDTFARNSVQIGPEVSLSGHRTPSQEVSFGF